MQTEALPLLRETKNNPYMLVHRDGRWDVRLKTSKLRPEPANPQPERGKIVYLEPIGPIRQRDVIYVATQNEPKSISFKSIMRAVCAASEAVTQKDLDGPRRRGIISHWRYIAFYLGKKHTGMSCIEMGRRMGGKDHTSVLHALKKVAADPCAYAADIARVEELL